MTSDHIVLPVSALKHEHKRMFDALEQGRTVYVSRHGDVVCAIHPVEDVPEGVAATYVIPGPSRALTAGDLAKSAPTKEVQDAIDGLPTLVTKNNSVYGIMKGAAAPHSPPVAVPSLEAASARSEAVREFLEDNQDASLDDVVDYRRQIDRQLVRPSTGPKRAIDEFGIEPDVAEWQMVGSTAVQGDLQQWVERGSLMERIVGNLFDRIAPSGGLVSAWAALHESAAEWRNEALPKFDDDTSEGKNAVVAIRKGLTVADTDPVRARGLFVQALVCEPDLHVGAMWKLGDLARDQGQRAEARTWYRLAMNWDEPDVAPTTVRTSTAAMTVNDLA